MNEPGRISRLLDHCRAGKRTTNLDFKMRRALVHLMGWCNRINKVRRRDQSAFGRPTKAPKSRADRKLRRRLSRQRWIPTLKAGRVPRAAN